MLVGKQVTVMKDRKARSANNASSRAKEEELSILRVLGVTLATVGSRSTSNGDLR